MRKLRSTRIADSAALATTLLFALTHATPVLADGGQGGSGGPGGSDSATAIGSNGVSATGGTGGAGGGGGAGLTGGAGGASGGVGGGGTGGAGGATAGQDGTNGVAGGDGGGGGGGGAHGYVGATLPGVAAQGGNGGNGGNGAVNGGGGGAGGWGAVVTGAGGGTLGVSVTGGNGGAGGSGTNGVPVGGSGGVGLDITSAGSALTIAAPVQGGTGGGNAVAGQGGGGAGGIGILASGRMITITAGGGIAGGDGASNTFFGTSGGAGLSGSDLAVVNAGIVSGGLSGDGATRANAITFTGGVNSLTLYSTSTITGNVAAFSTADTLALGGASNNSFNVSAIGPAAQYQNFGIYQKVDAGTWTLKGTTATVTPWQILGGTLAISSDANLGAAAGSVTLNGGTLETTASFSSARSFTLGSNGGSILTDSGTALTLAGTISGAGGLTVSGAGNLILTGNNTYSGPTFVNAGTLTVNGAITSASTINAGATLNGGGTIGAVTVANGGTLAVGDAATYTVLSTTGNALFQAGSNFGVKVAPNNVNDLLLVGGSANLAGGTVRVSATGGIGDYASTTKYLILNARGGITSPFAGVTTNLAFFNPSLTYDAHNVYLALGNPQFAQGASSPTQSAVAAALQGGFDAGETGPLTNLLEGLSSAQAGAALTQISGQGTTATQQTSFEAGKLFMRAMDAQAASWVRGDLNGRDETTIYVKPLAYAPIGTPDKSPFEASAQTMDSDTYNVRTWRAWGQSFTSGVSIGDRTGAGLGYSERSSGGAIGADYEINSNLLAGFAAGATSSNFQVPDSLTSGQLDAGHIGLYGVAKSGEFYFRSGLTYAHFINTTNRTVDATGVTQTERGHFGSDQLAGSFELGWRHAFGPVMITPFGSLAYYDTIQQAYSETGAATNAGPDLYGLKFGQRTAISMPVSIGAEIDGKLYSGDGTLWAPFARIALTHEFQPYRTIDASLLALPLDYFTVDGVQPQSNVAIVRLGSRIWFDDTISAFAAIDGVLGNRTQGYAATAGINILTGVETRKKQPAADTVSADTAVAPAWTSSAAPSLQIDTWRGSRGFPASGSLSPGSGSQVYSSLLLSVSGQPADQVRLDLTAKPGYVSASQNTPGLSGSVRTVTDTTMSGTFTYTGVTGVQPFFSLNLNIPSGKPALLGSAGNARMDPDYIEVPTFGEGLNIGPTLGVNLPFNDKFTMSISGGYTHHGPYEKDSAVDPVTLTQGVQNFAPGHDFSVSVNASYIQDKSSTQISTSYQHETITYLAGTPSYQLGDRFIASLTQSYAWSALTTSSFTATLIYGERNHTLDTSIPAFPLELADSNSTSVRLRLDQPFVIDVWTVTPFGTFVYRDHNSYDPAYNLFAPAKTLESAGGILKYAFSDKASINGSAEHFWAHEFSNPATATPSIQSDGWKLALSGMISF